MTLHASIPAGSEPALVHDFSVVDLPEVEAATLVHRGPTEQVIPSVQALARWIGIGILDSASMGLAREVTLLKALRRPHGDELQEPVACSVRRRSALVCLHVEAGRAYASAAPPRAVPDLVGGLRNEARIPRCRR